VASSQPIEVSVNAELQRNLEITARALELAIDHRLQTVTEAMKLATLERRRDELREESARII